jgi:hypothetical protein
MRNLVLGAAVVSLLALTIPDKLSSQSPSPSGAPLPLEQRVNDLEKRIRALEDIPAVATALRLQASNRGGAAAQTESAPASQPDSPLELVSWKYQFKPGQYAYESRHLFSYVLKNRSGKPIKLVDGTLLFTDLLGEKLIAIKLNPDVKYPAGEIQFRPVALGKSISLKPERVV